MPRRPKILKRRWFAVVLGIALLALECGTSAPAESPALIGGGLTALPAVVFGPDLLRNGGFEIREGGVPTGWSSSTGWRVDDSIRRSGAYSYRRSSGAPSVAQTLVVQPGTYALSAWIKTDGVGSGHASGVRLIFDARPDVNDWRATDVISGVRDWTRYTIPNIVVSRATTVQIILESYRDPAGTAWFDDVRLEEQRPPAVDVFMRYPNFRGLLFDDDAPTLTFDITVHPPADDPSGYLVRGVLRAENEATPVTTRSYPAAAQLVASLDGSAMQIDRPYLATFALIDASDGSVLFTYPAYRVSKVEAARRASMSVAIDAHNRVLVRGVPRFVLGVYDAGAASGAAERVWEDRLWSPTGDRRMRDLRINFYVNPWQSRAPAAVVRALAANLQRHGVTYLHTVSCADADRLDVQPGVGGYETADECSARTPAAFAQYERMRRLDPGKIALIANLGSREVGLWRDVGDVLGSDPLTLAGPESFDGWRQARVAEWLEAARAAVHDARPVMSVLPFFPSSAPGRFPTLAEMRDQAYTAIVAGASGLWWWSLGDHGLAAVCPSWCPRRTALMANLAALVDELAALEPALVADDAPDALAGVSPPRIRTRTKVVDGRGYVFAYNATSAPTHATFRWNSEAGAVRVNGEQRSLRPIGGSFTDAFGPYQAHVYVISSGGN